MQWAAAMLGLGFIFLGVAGSRLQRDAGPVLPGSALSDTRFRVFWGGDFLALYVTGDALIRGRNIYNHAQLNGNFPQVAHELPIWGMVYPPATGVPVAPLAFLPYESARTVWFGLNVIVLLAGMWQLLRVFNPGLDSSTRLLISGLLMCSYCTWWSLFLLQPSPLILGLLGLFLVALVRHCDRAVFCILLLACSLKITLCLPFLGLAMLRGRWRLGLLALMLWLGLNAVAFSRMGGPSAWHGYRANMARFEDDRSINSPNPWLPQSQERTDWPMLFNGFKTDAGVSRALSLGLCILTALWLFREVKRYKLILHSDDEEFDTLILFLAPLCCLTLLGFYHHSYDAMILLAPLLLGIMRLRQWRQRPGVSAGVICFASVVFLHVCLYIWPVFVPWEPQERSLALLATIKCFSSLSISLALAASLAALHSHLNGHLKLRH